uniref:ASPSCR1 tether for SLC2A4, UBX domain containing n=1 Tax=Oryzias sinensis TaxID=183150 RepID=A0A8C7X7T2_9TELE
MAASGSTVTVLTPNGRRQAVKVTPNSPLLQVLEEVCGKNGFNPDEYGLKFQRTVLDLTRPWRFANLPNNAKLEMVTSSRKQAAAESQVRVALQMEDGSRLQDSFGCGRSLWELITHFSSIRRCWFHGSDVAADQKWKSFSLVMLCVFCSSTKCGVKLVNFL